MTSNATVRLFDRFTHELLDKPGVQLGSGFGGVPGLRVERKIFAMLCRGELVVKLPSARVDEVVASGIAARFDARKDGRLMREWACIGPAHADGWLSLMHEALEYVSGLTVR